MLPHRLTRRDALRLGATGAALGLLAPRVASARSAPAPDLFELPLHEEGARAASAGWRTTKVYAAPHRFDMVGLRWEGRPHIHAQLRARRGGGAWSRWVELPAASHGPDRGALPAGTDPAWTGPADEIQLRLRGSAAGLRARFVATAAAHGGAVARAARSKAIGSQLGSPPIIPRAAWGGDSVPPRTDPLYGQVQLAFVHHTVTANDYTPEQSASIVLGIARYHRNSNGWNDIGYNFLVDKYGQIFEGRAGGIDQAIVGAQAQGYNSVSTGVACLGDFTAIPQNPTAIDAVARLIAWKLALHGMPVEGQIAVVSAGGPTNRYPSGSQVVLERISGHRDGDNTSCPGNIFYTQLGDVRSLAARYWVPPTGMTLHVASSQLVGAKPATLSGQLRFADGSTAGGAPVQILYGTAGSAYSPIGSTVCGADGTWTASVVVPSSGILLARFPGDAVHPLIDSPWANVTVVPSIALGLSSTRFKHGHSIAVSGVVTPAVATKVTVTIERQVGKVWKRVQTKTVPLKAGRYIMRRRMPTPGLYRATVAVGGASKAKRFRVVH